MSQVATEILIVFLLILANGLFSLAEMALVSSRKTRLLTRAEDGDPRAISALALLDKPNRLLSTVQIFITAIGIFSGALGGQAAVDQLTLVLAKIPWLAGSAEGAAIAIVVLTITFFSLVLGELAPKQIALTDAESFASRLAKPMQTLTRLAGPLVRLLNASTGLVLKVLGVQATSGPQVSEEEIKQLVQVPLPDGDLALAPGMEMNPLGSPDGRAPWDDLRWPLRPSRHGRAGNGLPVGPDARRSVPVDPARGARLRRSWQQGRLVARLFRFACPGMARQSRASFCPLRCAL